MHAATHRALTLFVFAAALLVSGAAAAGGRHGGHGGHGGAYYGGHGGYYPGHYVRGPGYWGPRWRSGVSIGIGLGFGGYWGGHPYAYGAPYYAYPGYAVAVPPPVYYEPLPQRAPEQPLAKGPPDPIFYPRNGQSVEQIEADRQDCNRWALTQPNAVARADVFHRATLACMEGRGYTVR
jgi:hypothetical protein